jgi:hypothetical protein
VGQMIECILTKNDFGAAKIPHAYPPPDAAFSASAAGAKLGL